MVPLFHPRRDRWPEHFRWAGARLVGISMVGRATVDVLAINSPANVSAREALIAEGRFHRRERRPFFRNEIQE